jgi:hypothetical protein
MCSRESADDLVFIRVGRTEGDQVPVMIAKLPCSVIGGVTRSEVREVV